MTKYFKKCYTKILYSLSNDIIGNFKSLVVITKTVLCRFCIQNAFSNFVTAEDLSDFYVNVTSTFLPPKYPSPIQCLLTANEYSYEKRRFFRLKYFFFSKKICSRSTKKKLMPFLAIYFYLFLFIINFL